MAAIATVMNDTLELKQRLIDYLSLSLQIILLN